MLHSVLIVKNNSNHNLDMIEKYYNLLTKLLSKQNNFINITYTEWLYYLESIYIYIHFINNINKKIKLENANILIEAISKKAADIDVNLVDILKNEIKLTKLLLEEYQINTK
jgi:hypothetical protein